MYKNNPFNIRTSKNKWLGQKGSENGFCTFIGICFGIRAAIYLIKKSYRRIGVITVEDVISRWAPPSENNTEAYINYVCSRACLKRSDCPCLLNFDKLFEFFKAMAYMESNFVLTKSLFCESYYML